MSKGYSEKVVKFGQNNDLVGILTLPTGAVNTDAPATIIVNSGIVHRVGTCRLSVKWARGMAQRGHTSLRFDLSGVGDSAVRRDSLAFEQSSILEAQDAMNFLQRRHKLGSFVLGGLCSGADVAYETGQVDDRVKGIIQIDPYTYENMQFYLHHYVPRLLDLGRWRRFIGRVLKRLQPSTGQGKEAPTDDLEMPTYIREYPPLKSVQAGYQDMSNKDISIMAVYTASAEYNHESQFAEIFAPVSFNKELKVVFLSNSDHMITTLPEQTEVLSEIWEWMEQVWPPKSPADVESAS